MSAGGPAVVGAGLRDGSDQLLVLRAPPAQPADLGLRAASQDGSVSRVPPHDGRDPPG